MIPEEIAVSITERLNEIEKRARAATAGPWEHHVPSGTNNHAVIADQRSAPAVP